MPVQMLEVAQAGWKSVSDPRSGNYRQLYELPTMIAENQILVLWKSSTYS